MNLSKDMHTKEKVRKDAVLESSETGWLRNKQGSFNSLFQSASCLNRARPGVQLSGRGQAQCVSQAHKLGKEKKTKNRGENQSDSRERRL